MSGAASTPATTGATPTAPATTGAASTVPATKVPELFDEVQGDILFGGLPKRTQTFLFFSIENKSFGDQLKLFVPQITTAAKVKEDREKIEKSQAAAKKNNTTAPILQISGVNISFTKKGLNELGVIDDIGDSLFNNGMLAGAKDLRDPGVSEPSGKFTPNWDKNWIPKNAVKGTTGKDTTGKDITGKDATVKDIHGLIMVTGDKQQTVDDRLKPILDLFNGVISQVHKLEGNIRPGDQKGHEHFGFLDGVSQPALKDVDDASKVPGQQVVPPGVILLGQDGDKIHSSKARPKWSINGSILAFRHLSQLVPEFNAFLEKNAISGLPPRDGAELLGARLMGRWKSGAPITVTPYVDDPAMGADPKRNDDFDFDQKSQARCPYAAHIRKTNPRGDLGLDGTTFNRIIRSGIPYGPEVSGKEALNEKTDDANDRGLLFVSYQSNLSQGFALIQRDWANNQKFFSRKDVNDKVVEPGVDPIIGQNSTLSINGADFKEPTSLKLSQWVIPKGGEYFFVPTTKAIRENFWLTKK